jgi:hypothetical protein
MGNELMPIEENRVFTAIGMLQSQVSNLADQLVEVSNKSTEEHRKVHDIVDAQSEAIRNLTRMVDEMKPHVESYKMKAMAIEKSIVLTEDYRDRQSEQRGEDRYKNWLYGFAASIGGLIVLILSKAWDVIASRPHIPVLIIIMLLLTGAAMAQEHHHPGATIQGATGLFYETWMRPDAPNSSCCNRADCDVAVDVQVVGGQLRARKRSGGPLIYVPREKIEQNRDSPDGQSHLCAIGATPLCFIAGAGG